VLDGTAQNFGLGTWALGLQLKQIQEATEQAQLPT